MEDRFQGISASEFNGLIEREEQDFYQDDPYGEVARDNVMALRD